MAAITIRRLPGEVHRALKTQAQEHGRSAEAEARFILARAVLPNERARAGDILCEIWDGADIPDLAFERDKTPHEPMSFE